jgi:tetratricopeptide (TPR) repeat protein
MNQEVNAWEETVVIPTYAIGTPEKNPMFLEKRIYQGSSGAVYPHAVIEKIEDDKSDRAYKAVFLENEYVKIMILPELGGRIQMAYDKVRERHFVYYNEVIKPALVGLTGPWISGGIEFNWPQHHRPSTFLPVDFTIRENADGSKTVWVNEIEVMFHTKGMAGFTLYPGKAYLEITGRLFNRTPFPQTFLWWANPAVKVNEHYQSVFPPDVFAVFDHGKRDVSDFPIATGTYYKVNYAPGTDISRYKNIPVPTSFMAINSRYNFMGGYEHDSRGGLLHVANHHISPGKKQWTWGNGAFGHAWDRNLTDADGPYIELMTGVFTDNQPDFSWLNPNEEKTFEQYFMPYTELGMVRNATKEAAINVEESDGRLVVKVYATAVYPKAIIRVWNAGDLWRTYQHDFSPVGIFQAELNDFSGDPAAVKVEVLAENGKVLVDYYPEILEDKKIPDAAAAAKLPSEIDSIELLYLNGLHLEQYRHATFQATDYYAEALEREPGDVRCNNAMGLWLLRRGKFAEAEAHFRRAVQTLISRNPNPYDGECYFNLGSSLVLQQRGEEAYAAFYKSTWNDAFQHSGFLALARIDAHRGDYREALRLVDKSLVRNYHSHTARHLKALLLRKLQQPDRAQAFITESLEIDPFNYGCYFERFLLSGQDGEASLVLAALRQLMRGAVNNYMEFALDYASAGHYDEAIALLGLYTEGNEAVYPMAWYCMGWCAVQKGEERAAASFFDKAALCKPDYCFPNRVEELIILEAALKDHPEDYKAYYYLGNFWYAARQYEQAIGAWEASVRINPAFPTTRRNLSLAYCNKLGDPVRALAELERAFALDPSDARVLMELDQLYKRSNTAPSFRLGLLEQYPALVSSRDDLYLEWVGLHNTLGQFDKARVLLSGRQFHPWEGGEGKVVGQYLLCHIEGAKACLLSGDFKKALDLLVEASVYPPNLGEGKLYGAQENDLHYLQALAYRGLRMAEAAGEKFRDSTVGISEPVQAIFYNDAQPDKIFYQGLAWRALGEEDKAVSIFNRLIAFGESHMDDKIRIDYFAVSLPDLLVFEADLDVRNRVHCHYLKGLGSMGLGGGREAEKEFSAALELDINHMGARVHQRMINYFNFDLP